MKMFVYRIFPIKNGRLVGKNSIFAAVWYIGLYRKVILKNIAESKFVLQDDFASFAHASSSFTAVVNKLV